MYGQATDAPDVTVTSSLVHSTDRDLWKSRAKHGRFRFVNYLGSAWIEANVVGRPPVRISFEVATPKLDYEHEYRSMVESIGMECQQLLLEWGTPASLNVVADPKLHAQTLLEQFLFLRHVLGPDKLDLYLETILRHAHSHLQKELIWKPSGTADPAFFTGAPLHRGHDWRRIDGKAMPGEIQEERKFESNDTPPNRFVKFALQCFHTLCDSVMNAKSDGQPAFELGSAIILEAASMSRSLDAFLLLPLFDEVGDLRRIPFESTTLQRREGYREVLLAWLMIDAAAHLDWPRREDTYDGTTRDVATLYEYWLYFILVRAFREKLGMIPEKDNDPLEKVDGALPFCCRTENGRLRINLRQREASFSRFIWNQGGQELRVHFFYNRSFSRNSVNERGSYSKTFRPDYTLVIIPKEYDKDTWIASEREAENAGCIAYLHFDAKYRGENLPGVFGIADKEEDGPEDARARATGTVKNVDLYKMHTYNEAIRRTIGSYVLYPGAGMNPQEASTRFERYHELIPGIGAFALRPSGNGLPPSGLAAVCDFIHDVLTHQLNRFTQIYRINYWTESTIREDRAEYSINQATPQLGNLPPKDTQLLLGYVRGSDAALECKDNMVFFCHAIEWKAGVPRLPDGSGEPGKATDLQFDPFRCDFFVAYFRNITLDWVAKIVEVRLVSAKERSEEIIRPSVEMNAAYYFRFQLAEVKATFPRNIGDLVTPRIGKPRICRFSEFARCPISI
ncbi:MAG: DUF2357 domain-containing protein [Candidatus Lindowbacteria bacterium]|nr:DUF2357 domain-containing protein [Candidatus Lindowbacteria bacterium]